MIGFPFDSHVTYDGSNNPVYDRAIGSESYRKLLGTLFTTGVMPTPASNLQVIKGDDDLTVIVQPGFAMVNGCMKLEENARPLVVQPGGNLPRIDTVVMRLNDNDAVRACDLYIIQGTPANDPVHPELTRTSSVYEIGLCDIFMAANSTSVTPYKMVDTRMDPTRCGYVSSVSEFDTSEIYAQLRAAMEADEAEFRTWLAGLKDLLDDNVAAKLSAAVTALQSRDEELQNEIDSKSYTAEQISYSNTSSGLIAETVQAALDEVAKPPIITRNITISGSVSTSGTAKNASIPAVDGYTPFAIAGWYFTGTGASATITPNMYIDGQTLKTYLRSISGTVTLTTASYVTVAYIKN